MKVLIIDDTKTKTETIVNYLNKLNITDVTTRNCRNDGLRGLMEQAKTGREYDLLILDMMFPIVRNSRIIPDAGIRVLEEIERRKWKIPVIMCSSEKIDDLSQYKNIIGNIIYNSSVYLLPEFKKLIFGE